MQCCEAKGSLSWQKASINPEIQVDGELGIGAHGQKHIQITPTPSSCTISIVVTAPCTFSLNPPAADLSAGGHRRGQSCCQLGTAGSELNPGGQAGPRVGQVTRGDFSTLNGSVML